MSHVVTVPSQLPQDSPLLSKAHQVFDELVGINQKLIALSNDNSVVAEISQLIMYRGQLLDEVQKIDFTEFAEVDKKELSEKLKIYQSLEEKIAIKFKDVIQQIESQLKGFHSGKKVLAGYKANILPQKSNIIQDQA